MVIAAGAHPEATARTRASLDAQSVPPWETVVTDAGDLEQLSGALARSTGELFCVVDAGDALHPRALEMVADAVGPDVDVVYTDEDHLSSDGGRHDPFFKPGWSPVRLGAQPYIGRLCAIRRSLLVSVGGFRAEAGAARDWDVALRVTEQARNVVHIPEVLYHRAGLESPWSIGEGEQRADAARVVNAHLERTGVPAEAVVDEVHGVMRLHARIAEHPKVSIVIPTAGAHRGIGGRSLCLVLNCVQSIVERSTYPDVEIVCVVDESVTTDLRRALVNVAPERVRLVEFNRAFNFSTKINIGALEATGDYLLLLNDDIEVITEGWIEEMLLYAREPSVGAVGATLRFADHRIQHAGVIAVGGNPGHSYYGFPATTRGYGDIMLVPKESTAVTAACLLSRRDVFEAVGGMSTQFPLNYNDVDYCLKLERLGYRVVHTPEADLYHYESSTRPAGEVDDAELELLHSRWGARLYADPYYSPHFLPTADYLTIVLPEGETVRDLDAAQITPSRPALDEPSLRAARAPSEPAL